MTDDNETFAEITSLPPGVELPEAPAAAPEPAPAPVAAPVEDDRVSRSEYLSIQRRHDEAMAEMALLRREREDFARRQQPQAPPDIFENPQQFVRQEMDNGLQWDRQVAITNSKYIAEARFGDKAVNDAMTAFDTVTKSGNMHPAENARVMNSPNPFAEAVKWHKEHMVRQTVGGDIDAYNARLEAKLLADPEFRKRADAEWRASTGNLTQIVRPHVVSSTPSISRVGAAALNPVIEDDQNDEELFKSTVARKKR